MQIQTYPIPTDFAVGKTPISCGAIYAFSYVLITSLKKIANEQNNGTET